MRTSYSRGEEIPKTPVTRTPVVGSNVSEVDNTIIPDSEDQAIQRMIVSGFTEVRNALDAKNSQQPAVTNPTAGSQQTVSHPSKTKETKPKKSKKWLIFVIIGILVSVTAVVAVLIFNGTISIPGVGSTEPTSEQTEAYDPQHDTIAKEISKLYVDETKSEIKEGYTSKDLGEYYDMLDDAEDNGEDVSDLEKELDTISAYMLDRSRISAYENADYDLAPESVLTDVLKIKASADKYSVLGLKNTIYGKADSLLAMREEYTRIKSELLGVSDLMSFDGSSCTVAISAITHTKNAEELTLLLAKVSADSTVVRTEAMLEAVKGTDGEAEASAALENAKEAQKFANDAWDAFNSELVDNP